MSTQKDIYAAGSESRPPMLNKEYYVPWSSCLLCYAKSKPNGKLIHNSIINGPYVRRMIRKLGDTNWEEIWLRVQQMRKGSDIGIQKKKAKLFNEWERQYAGQNVGNLNGYNAVQNVGNQVAQNPRVQNVGNQNGQIARAKENAAGHNGNQIRCYSCRGEEAGIQLQAEEFDLMAGAADLDEIEEVNASCILMANLQQASTSGTQTGKAPGGNPCAYPSSIGRLRSNDEKDQDLHLWI
nr:Gag-Pol polyprotein [Tanacetum cinerariifolium]